MIKLKLPFSFRGMKYSSADADPSAFQAMSVSSIPPRDKFVVNSSASFFGGCSTHQIQRGPDGITQTIMIIPDLNLKPREIPFCRKLGNIIAPSLLGKSYPGMNNVLLVPFCYLNMNGFCLKNLF